MISDIGPLGEFKSLTNLTNLELYLGLYKLSFFSKNNITDISPLEEFRSLTSLSSLKIGLGFLILYIFKS